MRFAFVVALLTLFALPLMAKTMDNARTNQFDAAVNDGAASMMAVIADMDQVRDVEPASAEVAAMAEALNAIDVGVVN